MDGNFFLLEVKDNGKGFNPSKTETKEEGLGLATIRERVELLGGILRIKSSGTMGTSVSIEVPVE
jgi:signal transduction histidine kinase